MVLDIPKAKHFPGGNYFDNMLIDIKASYKKQDNWLNNIAKNNKYKRLKLYNIIKLYGVGFLQKKKLLEPLIMTGFMKDWFVEFEQYWRDVLNGRPITLVDFHNLRFSYRSRFQSTESLSWDNNLQHLENWQKPYNIYTLFAQSYNLALNPVSHYKIFKYMKNNMKMLEFGCSLAPAYRTYKYFFNHIITKWILADIPNFAFHFARHAYATDHTIEKMIVIDENQFDDPLESTDGLFDMIIITAVFEHLHKPRHIAEYLFNRLNIGGYLIFDYVKSETHGHDSIAGLEQRIPTLQFLSKNLDIIFGSLSNINESIGLCIGKRVSKI